MIRCFGCMKTYDSGKICPHCGYVQDTPIAEEYYLLPGSKIHEKYLVGRVVGYGGFGITYVGYDEQLDRKVAIKEYLPSSFSTRTYGSTQVTSFSGDRGEQFRIGLKRFIDEARRLAAIQKSDEIVHIYDCFMENDTGYIIMEYVEGTTVKEMLKASPTGTLSYEETKKIIVPVLRGLSVIHKQGLIHRDIAPDNIIVTAEGQVKILDFGAARFATANHSRSLSVILKPGYAPEEQYRTHGNQGPWTDMYEVGATMYRMLTGKLPQEASERLMEDHLKSPSQLGVTLPENVENAIMNSLNIRAENRIQDAQQFCNALCNGEEVKRVVVAETKEVVEPEKLTPKIKMLLAGSFAVVAIVIALFATGTIDINSSKITGNQGEEAMSQDQSYIPDMAGMTYDDASKSLVALGMEVVINGMNYSESIAKNTILSQTPAGGSKATKGDTVYVVMSGGQEEIMMPDVVGNSKDKAMEKLEAQTLQLGEVAEEYSDVVAKGYVISQSVEAEEKIALHTKVDLVISKGNINEETAELQVPNLVGASQEEAAKILADMKEREGFTYPLGEVEHEYSQTVPKGQIISQSPEANTTARTDEPISIVVSDGPEMVNMISVVYTSKEDAVSALEALGLTAKTTEDYSSSVEKGCVISQSIEAGTQVEKGSMVMLSISKGKRPQTQNNTSQTTQNDTAQTQQNLPQQTQQQVQPQQTQQSQPQQGIQSYSQDMTQDVHTYQDGSADVGNIGVKQESIE